MKKIAPFILTALGLSTFIIGSVEILFTLPVPFVLMVVGLVLFVAGVLCMKPERRVTNRDRELMVRAYWNDRIELEKRMKLNLN